MDKRQDCAPGDRILAVVAAGTRRCQTEECRARSSGVLLIGLATFPGILLVGATPCTHSDCAATDSIG